MGDDTDTTLMETARRYLASLPDENRVAAQPEVERFVRWCGADRPCGQLRGQVIGERAAP